jgi:pyruvate dehydrogenase kinase 2/3/4
MLCSRTGGIPTEIQEKIWKYGFTTVLHDQEAGYGLGDLDRNIKLSPIAGLGFGLPLSRLHAKHFGGDLKLIVLEGFGTDAHLRLDRSGSALEAFDFSTIQ